MEILKVSSRSNPNSVAGALAGVVRQSGAVEMQVVGAGALNQAVKAIAIARGYVVPSGLDLVCIPTFADIEIDGEDRTAIRLTVEDRNRRKPIPLGGEAAVAAPTIEIDAALQAASARAVELDAPEPVSAPTPAVVDVSGAGAVQAS